MHTAAGHKIDGCSLWPASPCTHGEPLLCCLSSFCVYVQTAIKAAVLSTCSNELVRYVHNPNGGTPVLVFPPCRPDEHRWRPLGALSGGQQALVGLALAFALQAALPSPFYFFDEVGGLHCMCSAWWAWTTQPGQCAPDILHWVCCCIASEDAAVKSAHVSFQNKRPSHQHLQLSLPGWCMPQHCCRKMVRLPTAECPARARDGKPRHMNATRCIPGCIRICTHTLLFMNCQSASALPLTCPQVDAALDTLNATRVAQFLRTGGDPKGIAPGMASADSSSHACSRHP
jgi:hypothetical protein